MTTVLFVDDEPQVLAAMRRALFAQPFEFVAAATGLEALAVLASRHIDVVVSDEQLPDITGTELLTRARAKYPRVARIILTGHANLEGTLRAINQAAVFRYLQKPCCPREIAASIRDALRVPGETREEEASLRVDFDACLTTINVVFQPIFELATLRPIAVEALARPTHPTFPTILALIAVAERLGREPEMDHAIHRVIANILPMLPPDLSVYVNVHPTTLADPRTWAPDAPLAPFMSRLVIEITERALLRSGTGLTDALAAVRNLDGRIAIDDLGAGHSALGLISTVRPDVIKLDMSLIRGLDTNPALASVVAALLDLGRRLDVPIIAEGVETEGERQTLMDLGAELVQGYLFARPAPFPLAS